MTGGWPADAPPELPADADRGELQCFEDGVGPLAHRIYRTRIVGSTLTPAQLMARMARNLDGVAPSEFATFQKVEGEKGDLRKGNRYVVRMPGPWDGPVRVVAVDPTSFRLATLPGHLEAGQIEFRARLDYRSLWFEIESWARSGGRFSDLLYSRLRVSKEVQLHMWSSVLRQVVDLADGEMEGGIVITTRVVEADALPGARGDGRIGRRNRLRLAALADRRVNFDNTKTDVYASEPAWNLDDMVEALPHERPGPLAEDESWQVARGVMDSYQLADPGVVTASYDRSLPLSGRDMLLRIRFAGLRFRVGVRIGDVYEERRDVDGHAVHVFGWSYSTLEGHFEEGQMHYELWKWQDSGDVEFHLKAISRAARKGPFLLRIGFRLFGRSNQLRFYRQVCRRIKRLTEAQLETQRAAATR
ncbi:MAG TPA: DUF1990 family protein [Solirubrobacterales bacterium]|nr:DUF1990 family protein [Solirubrobacterales bacterium]